MYEQSPQALTTALATVTTDSAVRYWTVADMGALALQALALMERAGAPLPPGTVEEFVSLRAPQRLLLPVATKFCPWTTLKRQQRSAARASANLGEVHLGDNLLPAELSRG